MGVIPVRTQRASYEVVRYALAIFKFINLCTLLIFWALCFFLIHSIHSGAPYAGIGSIAPLYMILKTSCFSPQFMIISLTTTYNCTDGAYQLVVTGEGLPSSGLLQRFAWNSVRWSKLKVSLRILAVFLSVLTLN